MNREPKTLRIKQVGDEYVLYGVGHCANGNDACYATGTYNHCLRVYREKNELYGYDLIFPVKKRERIIFYIRENKQNDQ